MSFRAFASSVNVIAMRKDDTFRAMTAAWAMMADYDCLLLLLGGQSETGRAVEKGDVLGISALAEGQMAIGERIGECHSGEVDKEKLAPFIDFHEVPVVKGSKVVMKVEVLEIYHLPQSPEDNLLYVRVVAEQTDEGKKFLVLD